MALVSMIAALGKARVIGRKNILLWPIPEDLKRFKALTMGHPIVMGRKTFESIGRVLPGRTNIVVTREQEWNHEGVVVTHSLEEAIKKAKEIDVQEVFVIGGAQIYEQALPLADKLYLTLVDAEEKGDAYFPPYEHLFTKETVEKNGGHEGLKYSWVNLER